MNAFKSGYGESLYFEDSKVVESLQENFDYNNFLMAQVWNVAIFDLDSIRD